MGSVPSQTSSSMKHLFLASILALALILPAAQALFFGPVAVGLGLGLVALKAGFFLGAALSGGRSRRTYYRKPRSYHYTPSNHYHQRSSYYARPSRNYYYSSHRYSHYGKRSAEAIEEFHRVRRSVAQDGFSLDAWYTEMTEKDQDDCSKLLICELRAKEAANQQLSEIEKTIADYFGNGKTVDVSDITVEFDLAAQVGKYMGAPRCQELYAPRCDATTSEMVEMIKTEYENFQLMMKDLHNINEVDNTIGEEKDMIVRELQDQDIEQGQIWSK